MSNKFERRKHFNACPRPNCCEKIEKTPIVFLVAQTFEEGQEENPYWAITVETPQTYSFDSHDFFWSFETVKVTHCPFCAIELPEVSIKEKLPSKIRVVTDGGYYCDTCQERLICCECWAAETKYQIKGIE